MQNIWLFLCFILMLAGCKQTQYDPLSEPVVTIENKVLTQRQLQNAIPNNMSVEDSTVFAQDYINRWVKTQLMLRKAELNLTPTEKDVAKLLDEYRTSLLTHLYQQKLIEQKYAPMITGSEIEAYYNDMRTNFKLLKPIIKGVFVKLPKNTPKINDIEKWIRSDKPGDLVDLESYCYQYAKKFELFIDDWKSMEHVEYELPNTNFDLISHFKRQNFYKTQDNDFVYLVAVRQIISEDEYAPLEFVSDKIKSILLNKKRIEFIKKLEEDIYDEGLKQKVVKFN